MKNKLPSAKVFTIACFIVFVVGCGRNSKDSSPDAALSSFELEPGFKIELLASEPLLGDPVDMEIDEAGRLYVVEMFGYPLDKSGTGKVNLLSDTDGDGRMDKSVVFAENLVLPNSVMRWKKGILVTDAPYVLYFEDTNGDGHAEVRDTVLAGFALSNPQHNLNNPVLSIDNWIYLGHEGAVGTDRYKMEFGDPGHEVYYPHKPNADRLGINAGGRGVRFRPDRGGLEMTSSHTQFGHAFDTWGHHILVSNANHIFQEAIAERYLVRNPDLIVSDVTESLSDHGEASEVFPITRNPQNQLLTDVGVITSACGTTIYDGGVFPELYNRVSFVAEPVSNLVHADVLTDRATLFNASRLHPHQEFLASRDPKFRPVNMYVGPDGALYVVDFYRQIIEHPEWMSDDVIKSGELYNDSDKGRIYRISRTDAGPPFWTKGLTLGELTDEKLVDLLADSNGWTRRQAQRLIVDRATVGIETALRKLAVDPGRPLGRLHALWALEGIGKLDRTLVAGALNDLVPGIRENAIRLSEPMLPDDALTTNLLALAHDPDAKVRYQLLCTLGSISRPDADKVRNEILFHDLKDPWVQIAALSVPSSQANGLLQAALDHYSDTDPATADWLSRAAAMASVSRHMDLVRPLIRRATQQAGPDGLKAAILEGLAQGYEDLETKTPLSAADQDLVVNTCLNHNSSRLRKASFHILQRTGIDAAHFGPMFVRARKMASDTSLTADRRAEAIDFLSLRNPDPDKAMLLGLLEPREELSVQLASIRTLNHVKDTAISAAILNKWPLFTSSLRDAAIRIFVHDEQRSAQLLDAIESGRVPVADISWPRKVGLMAQSNDSLRNKARRLFTMNKDNEINRRYETALHTDGDAVKGQAVYEAQCSICHQIRGGGGVAIGPDLGTIHNWPAEAIMANILDPSQSISSGYDLWQVELKNGESFQGIVSAETPGALTFRNAGMMERSVRRQDIKSLKALPVSAMTAGLDKSIDVTAMSDLLAFLKKNK